jgi:serine phosphatase RsbU (regulator of sigma subunit)
MSNFIKKKYLGYFSLLVSAFLLFIRKDVISSGYFFDIIIGLSIVLLVSFSCRNIKRLPNLYSYFISKPTNAFIDKVLNLCFYFIIIFIAGLILPDLDSIIVDLINSSFVIISLFLVIRLSLIFYDQVSLNRQRIIVQGFGIIIISILARYILEILLHYGAFEEYLSFTLKVLKFLIFIFLGFYSLSFASNNNWVHYLKRNEKSYLFWSLLSINVVLVSYLLSFASRESDGFIFFEGQMPGSPVLISSIIYFLLGVSIRFSITSLFSFSSSEVVEKKQTELSTLTYINNVITKTKELDKVVDVVNELTKNYTGALITNISIYANHLEKIFSSTNGATNKLIEDLKEHNNFKDAIAVKTTPILVNSISDIPEYHFIKNTFPDVNAFIYIPIIEDYKIGSILVLHQGEYIFEGNEIEILDSFSDNLKIAIDNSKLDIEIREKERLQSEFKIAKDMQESLLPAKLNSTDHYDLDGFSIPAEEVGGDFFDELTLRTGKKCCIQGDVSGKGIGASFFMAQIKGIAMALANESATGHELLCKINTTLHGNIAKNLFVTMALLEFDNLSDKITYLRAGHTPLAINFAGNVEFLKPKGIGIGFVDSSMFDKNLESVEFVADKIICFTDGINELRNSDEQDYGFSRIKNIIEKDYQTAEEINSNLVKDLKDFSKDATQHDDMTVISIIKKK